MSGPSPSGGWVDHCELTESPRKGVSLTPGIKQSPRKGVRQTPGIKQSPRKGVSQTPGMWLADALMFNKFVLILKVVTGFLLLPSLCVGPLCPAAFNAAPCCKQSLASTILKCRWNTAHLAWLLHCIYHLDLHCIWDPG